MVKSDCLFPIVGVGASAGGIAALNTFFDHMPPDSGMAFVVILHLDPSQASRVAEIIATHTAMPVVQAEQGMPVEPDRVYVIPPATLLGLGDEVFRLEEMNPERVRRRPVDHFFTAVAALRGEQAVGVILSGTGSNGSEGISRIKEAGGLVAVQDPETAEYPGMPQNAVATGFADIVQPLESLAGTIQDVILHNAALPRLQETPSPMVGPGPFDRILATVRAATGNEFRCYKDATVGRRIYRRMSLKRQRTLDEYQTLLRDDPREAAELARDLLIHVTSFFRDPLAWEDLRTAAIRPLVTGLGQDHPIRAWVPGCATGEEAYSLTMLLIEEADAAGVPISIRVFATDASEDALMIARKGAYPASVVETLSNERIQRFFTRDDDTYRVRSILRDAVTFAPQNLLQDPPFSHMDIVSCRNVLIYLKPEIQQKLLALFHFSLRDGGTLFLGPVETAAGPGEGFETISKCWRIHRRCGPSQRENMQFPIVGGTVFAPARKDSHLPSEPPRPHHRDRSELARRILLDRYAPPSVLTDRNLQILMVHGDTGPFLRHPDGKPTQDLTRHLRGSLPRIVLELVNRATRQRQITTDETVLTGDNTAIRVMVTVTPINDGENGAVLLISFQKSQHKIATASPALVSEPRAADDQTDDAAMTQHSLEQDLMATREQLRLTVRQVEASNEDLKASNEEILSMNEELQSTNEELESSKEELQSLNEELNTLNNQLQDKVRELESKSNDLNNLLNSTDTPTLFLDQAMTVRWFTPSLRRLVDLTPGDIGRPFASFTRKVVDETFEADAGTVLSTLIPEERQVPGTEGDDQWFMRRILPYRTEDDRIDGIVVTFSDISERRRFEQKLQSAKEFAEAIVETVRSPLLILDADQMVVSANRAFYDQLRIEPQFTKGRYLSELSAGQWNIPDLTRLIKNVLPENQEVEGYELKHDFSDLGPRTLLVNAMRLDSMDLILVSIEDVTQDRLAEERRRERDARQTLLVEVSDRLRDLADPAAAQAVGCEILARHLGANHAVYAEIVEARDEAVVARDWTDGTIPSMAGNHSLGDFGAALISALACGKTVAVDDVQADPGITASGVPRVFAARSVVAFVMVPLVKGDRLAGVLSLHASGPRQWSPGNVALVEEGAARIWSEVERARAEEALRDNEERLRLAVEATSGGVFAYDLTRVDHDFVNDRCVEILGVSRAAWPDRDHLQTWLLDRVHPDDAAEVNGRAADLIGGGADRLDLDFRVRLADEASRWVRVVAQAARGSGEDGAQRITGILFDIDARKTIEERFAHLALHDPLTGLPNRSLFSDRLDTALTQARRQGNHVALALLDIDKFKAINDTLGHVAGDHVLRQLGSQGATALRPLDTFARLGGDEFAVILPDLESGTDASHVLDRFLAGLDLHAGEGDRQVLASISMGVAIFPQDGENGEALFSHADLALYRAKDLEGDQMCFFEPSLGAEVQRRRTLADGLKQGIAADQFEVHYQPLLDLRRGSITGTEALVRWNHPTDGLVLPDDFIPMAEETDHIILLGGRVLEDAVRQTRFWRDEGLDLRIAINLSAKELKNQQILERMDACLIAHGIEPEALEIELTESTLFRHDCHATARFVQGARHRNFTLVIDDFGTGFSAFSYLHYLPITKIKLDRSFIAAISDPDHEALVGGLVDLGHRLGCRVTGEGVETAEQLRFLLRVGCDEAQGFLIAPPMRAGEVSAVVRDINRRGLSAFLPEDGTGPRLMKP